MFALNNKIIFNLLHRCTYLIYQNYEWLFNYKIVNESFAVGYLIITKLLKVINYCKVIEYHICV